MKLTQLCLVAVLAIVITPSTGNAADPDPSAPTGSGPAGENEPAAPGVPALDINQAELEAVSRSKGLVRPEFDAAETAAASPLMQSIRALTAAADAQVAEMQARLDNVGDDMAALEIVRAMERVKVQTELDILAVQAAHARRTGRDALAEEIDAAIRTMTDPRPAAQPVPRAAPGARNR